jgi:serine/threonine protein kinase
VAVRDEDVNRLQTMVHGDTFGDRFEIVAEAGSGGMGKVFEAIDRLTGGRVALKVVTAAGDFDRFKAEAEILETLEHPGIVNYVCHGVTSDGHPYLAMEWLVGESLSKRLKRGPLTIPEAVTLGERLAGALAHAHAHHVVHRDLKPSNIYLVDGKVEHARLIDFGVAKTEDRDLTRTGQMIGTPGYMAPEQVRGEKTVDSRADVFALGCVLYEALAGTPPYDGSDVTAVITRLLLDKHEPITGVLPDIPPRIVHLIDAMLVKDQTRRLADIGVARDELATITKLLETGDLPGLRTRSPSVPIPPADDAVTVGRPSFVLHPDASNAAATLAERPNARRPEPSAKKSLRIWFVFAICGALFGIGVGLYLVLGIADSSATATEVQPIKPVAPAPSICKDNLRTGCGALCEAADAEACYLHADNLVAGKTGTVNREPAVAAFHRGCEARRRIVSRATLLEHAVGEVGLGEGLNAVAQQHVGAGDTRSVPDQTRFVGCPNRTQRRRRGEKYFDPDPLCPLRLCFPPSGSGRDCRSCGPIYKRVPGTQQLATRSEVRRDLYPSTKSCWTEDEPPLDRFRSCHPGVRERERARERERSRRSD